ncbi:putative alcohol dehydrogenase [Microthyrium microscopicum]|uniref:Putative alcohol dehydrogenase n=1 Tax=Microthyrium microscopicum TaxID=703497 RepID=A0A6A6U774_9PEZI|nr:putative alcohol dehydrogenase [Microthyrium microscopicum]
MSTEPEIPKKYKAAVYDEPGKISTKVVELDMPEPGHGQVLINLTASGVCHSDLGVMTNTWAALPAPTQPGQVGGHEGVGKIVKLGPGTESVGVKVGDRVGIKWVSKACLNCGPCLAGRDAQCKGVEISGYYTPGTFQQYALAPANYVTPIPDGVSDIEAAPFLCAGVTVYAALRKSGAQSGDWVVIIGAGGGLGHMAVQLASKAFAMRVIGIDSESKRQLVLDSGAEHFLSFGSRDAPVDTPAEVQKLTGEGAHAVIVVAAVNAAYTSALPMLRFGGRVVAVGIPEGGLVGIASASPQLLIGKELTVVGSSVGTRKDAIETLNFAARGVVKMHVKSDKMENLTQIFQDMNDGKLQGRVVLDLTS